LRQKILIQVQFSRGGRKVVVDFSPDFCLLNFNFQGGGLVVINFSKKNSLHYNFQGRKVDDFSKKKSQLQFSRGIVVIDFQKKIMFKGEGHFLRGEIPPWKIKGGIPPLNSPLAPWFLPPLCLCMYVCMYVSLSVGLL